MKRRLVQYFKRQILLKKQKDKLMIDKYDSLHMVWQKKSDRFENSARKKQKDLKYREVFEKIFPELKKQREEKERIAQKQKAALAAAAAAATAPTEELGGVGTTSSSSSALIINNVTTAAAAGTDNTAELNAAEV
jgi:hypothetical protein